MLLLIMLLAAVAAKESFTESLEIIQNKNGKVGFSFHFKTKIPALFDGAQDDTEFANYKEGGGGAKHHRLLAKSISDLIERFKVQELHLSFTQGRWAYDRWNGFGFSDGRETPVPPGLFLISFPSSNMVISPKVRCFGSGSKIQLNSRGSQIVLLASFAHPSILWERVSLRRQWSHFLPQIRS